eukprot:s469_g7.t1
MPESLCDSILESELLQSEQQRCEGDLCALPESFFVADGCDDDEKLATAHKKEWLKDFLAALRVCADWSSRREQRVRNAQFQHAVDLSLLHFGGSLAHAVIKPPKCEAPHCFEIPVSFEAKLMRNTGKQKPSILLFRSMVHPVKLCAVILTVDLNWTVSLRSKVPVLVFGNRMPPVILMPLLKLSLSFGPLELVDPEAWKDFLRILERIPPLPTPSLAGDQTIDEWKWAIRATKPETARGVCALSQPEMRFMHDSLLGRLVQIFNKVDYLGLPEWLMLAKVFLVPKCNEASTFEQMRPITVFALVFRIWTKVAARRLLLQWKLTIPKNVGGAIPGRSSTTLTLDTGLRIENFLRLGTDAGGFNLDISKCFNRFGRLPISLLLRKNGFDDRSCAFWINSLKRMTRSASILGSASLPSPATTGLAEGDPLSVCSMILVGYGWHFLISQTGAVTAVFADDWSWTATESAIHIAAMKLTKEFLSSLKLVSDPAKCWYWGATKKARQAWHEINKAAVGAPRHFTISLAEKELGLFMHFSKVTHLGCQKSRIEAAVAKLQKLSKLSLSTRDKALLIQTSVWPTAFFGVEAVYVGQKHFTTLRSHATQVLTTKTKATSTWLSLSAAHEIVFDPFLYALMKVLLAWRRLMVQDPENVDTFKHVLVNASGDPNKAYGPAAALKCYLEVIGWSINEQGDFIDHCNQIFMIQDVCMQWLKMSLWSAWDKVVTATIQQRSGMHDWPEVDLLYTRSLPLPEDQRDASLMLIMRTLGTLFATQRDHWGNEEYPEHTTCPMCNGPDDRAHFPMQCEALADLRKEFEKPLCKAQELFPHVCFLPVVYKHPKAQLVQSIFTKWKLPEAFDLNDFSDNVPLVPSFYTDGSCPFPQLHGSGLCTWSVVWDSLDNDLERSRVASLVRNCEVIPETLIPIQASLVHGPQTVNRAELTAIIQIVKSVDAAVIHSDSSWAIAACNSVRDDPFPDSHACKPNSDLLLWLCSLACDRDLSNYQLMKIKSHLQDSDARDDLHLYHILGNRLADDVAGKASKPVRSPLHAACWELAEWYNEQIGLLKELVPFFVRTYACRLDAFQEVAKKADAKDRKFRIQDISTWNIPAEPCCKVVDIPDDAFLPGASVLQCIVRWASTILWPSSDDVSGGISTYELAANFVGTTACALPRKVAGKFQSKYLDPLIAPGASLIPRNQWDDVRVVEMAELQEQLNAAFHNSRESRKSPEAYSEWIQSQAQYRGRIRSFSEAKGFGFIDCPETMQQFGRDVFVHKFQLHESGAWVGQDVLFEVELNKTGHPQARNIVLANPAEGMWDYSASSSYGTWYDNNNMQYSGYDYNSNTMPQRSSSPPGQAPRDTDPAVSKQNIEDMIRQCNSPARMQEIIEQYGQHFLKRHVVTALYQLGLCRQHDKKQGNLQATESGSLTRALIDRLVHIPAEELAADEAANVQWALAALEEVKTHPRAHQYAFQLGQQAKKRYMEFSPSQMATFVSALSRLVQQPSDDELVCQIVTQFSEYSSGNGNFPRFPPEELKTWTAFLQEASQPLQQRPSPMQQQAAMGMGGMPQNMGQMRPNFPQGGMGMNNANGMGMGMNPMSMGNMNPMNTGGMNMNPMNMGGGYGGYGGCGGNMQKGMPPNMPMRPQNPCGGCGMAGKGMKGPGMSDMMGKGGKGDGMGKMGMGPPQGKGMGPGQEGGSLLGGANMKVGLPGLLNAGKGKGKGMDMDTSPGKGKGEKGGFKGKGGKDYSHKALGLVWWAGVPMASTGN